MQQQKFYEALKSGRCIICFLMRKDESDILTRWVAKGEEEVQKKFNEQKGLCNYRLWKLEKLSTNVTMAEIAIFLLEKFLGQLNGQGGQRANEWLRDHIDHQNCFSYKILSVRFARFSLS
jgi:hypothetical protein